MPAKNKSPRYPIPEPLRKALINLQNAVDELSLIAGHKQKKFTLDGRLIGDLGEVIAAHFFEIELTESQEAGFDAKITIGPNKGDHVEIKCRRKSDNIEFKTVPKHLIVLKVLPGDHEVELRYAGDGGILNKLRRSEVASKFTVSTTQLAKHFDHAGWLKSPTIPLRPLSN